MQRLLSSHRICPIPPVGGYYAGLRIRRQQDFGAFVVGGYIRGEVLRRSSKRTVKCSLSITGSGRHAALLSAGLPRRERSRAPPANISPSHSLFAGGVFTLSLPWTLYLVPLVTPSPIWTILVRTKVRLPAKAGEQDSRAMRVARSSGETWSCCFTNLRLVVEVKPKDFFVRSA